MKNMSENLVQMIEKNADQLSKTWLKEVRKHPKTKTYHTYNEKELYNRAYDVYSRLSTWLSEKTTVEEISRHYIALGKQRRREGFAFSEVFQALAVTRRILWFKVLSDGLMDSALELYKALELNNRVVHFFDQAMYYTAVGFEQAK